MYRFRIPALVFTCLFICACQPEDRSPGLWLSGETKPFPADWSFTNEHREVALEVTPPHSITIWCAELDGDLYVAASRPDEKNWPGWVEKKPDVRIRVGNDIYDARLVQLSDQALISRIQTVQAAKYDLDPPSGPTTSRYWSVTPQP